MNDPSFSVKQARMKIREVELFQNYKVNWLLSKQSSISTMYGDSDASGLCSQELSLAAQDEDMNGLWLGGKK